MFKCPHCDEAISDKLIAKYAAGRAGRKNAGKPRAPGAGRPRKIQHNPKDPNCRCVDCRRDKGYLPPKKSTET